jgi:AcrR family transcriptional regulator
MRQEILDPVSEPRRRARLRRSEKHEEARRRLFAAAIKVVGKYGYAEASVARITAEAEVAQGTFYLHFDTRQALLDELLPAVANEISTAVRLRGLSGLSEEEQEIERFRAFFDVLNEVPEFFRILNEAELFAPDGYRRHIGDIVDGYAQILKRGFDRGDPDGYSDDELRAIVHVLLGARAYLAREYAKSADGPKSGNGQAAPEFVMSAYAKLIRRGLFPRTTAPVS